MLSEKVKTYLLYNLAGTPDVLDALLANVSDAAVYDRRPDPARFTLREALAHWADWEGVFRGRLEQTRDTENATLVGYDEGQWAIDHDYAHADPDECRRRFRAGREQIVALLRGLTSEQWARAANHTELGPITLEEQAVLIAGHDGYHLQQVVAWLK